MAEFLIRDVKDETIKRLKARAKLRGGTLADEIRRIFKIEEDIQVSIVSPKDDKKRRSR